MYSRKNDIKFLFILAVVVALCSVIPSRCKRCDVGNSNVTEALRDTITITDTIFRVDTARITSTRLSFVTFRDTVFIKDIAKKDSFVVCENKVYKDSTYTAWVSGINASLDSIETYITNSFITKTVTERIIVPSDGLFAGVGIISAGERFSPSIGINYAKGSFLYGADIGVIDDKPLFRICINYKIR